MNLHDSEILAGQLEEMGFVAAGSPEEADLLLFNTCTVRETAANKVMGELARLKQLKERRPDLLIGVCGCMAQEAERVEEIRRRYPHVDLVFGTHNLHRLPELVERALHADGMVVDVWRSAGPVVEHLPVRRADRVRAWVTVIYGCDKHCTYCIVPFTRGRERSRRPEDVLAEVWTLAEQGYREITFLGQNVTAYGKDLGMPGAFADLLRSAGETPGLRWIRFLTSHPRDFPRELVDAMAELPKVCRHIHLPVQAGSDRVLRRMNRRYTRDEYLDLLAYIRRRLPDASVTTDVIVGFPGETDEDFADTLDLVRRAEFDNAFMFVYSPRRGTPAARWEDPVPLQEKKRRLQALMQVQYAVSRRRNEALVGRVVEVLVEGPSEKDQAVYAGRTATNKLVLSPRLDGAEGRFARVEIVEARTWTLHGRFVGWAEETPTATPVDAPGAAADAAGAAMVAQNGRLAAVD